MSRSSLLLGCFTGLLLIGLGVSLAASEHQKAVIVREIATSRERQDRVRLQQFEALREQIDIEMREHSNALQDKTARVIHEAFQAAGESMMQAASRRERAELLIGEATGVPVGELEAIFAEPLPRYGTMPTTTKEAPR